MSPKKKKLWVFSIILIYIAVAIAGFLIYYIVKKDFITPVSQATQTSTAARVPVIPGWKTYTISDENTSFMYPPDDSIQSKSYGFGVSSITLQTGSGNVDFQILIIPQTLAHAVGQNFNDYYAMQNNTSKIIKSPLSQDNATETFTKIKNRVINGLEAVNYQSIATNAPAGTQPEIGTFIQDGSTILLFSTGENNKMKLDQLLSSFQNK